jgi:hypothetical protein
MMKSTRGQIWCKRRKKMPKRRQNKNNNNNTFTENVCDYYRYFPTDLPKDAFGFCEKILLCLLLFPTRSRGEDCRRADDEEGGCEIVS